MIVPRSRSVCDHRSASASPRRETESDEHQPEHAETVFGGGGEQTASLFRRQHLDKFSLHLPRLDERRAIAGDELVAHGIGERLRKIAWTVLQGARGQRSPTGARLGALPRQPRPDLRRPKFVAPVPVKNGDDVPRVMSVGVEGGRAEFASENGGGQAGAQRGGLAAERVQRGDLDALTPVLAARVEPQLRSACICGFHLRRWPLPPAGRQSARGTVHTPAAPRRCALRDGREDSGPRRGCG